MRTDKKFFGTAALVVVILLLCACIVGTASGCQKKLEMTVLESTIDIGIEQSFTVLHASDTHITLYSKSDKSELISKAKNRSKRFGRNQEKNLEFVTDLSKEKGCKVIHTGDFMDFPTNANIDRLKKFLEETDCLYIPGNHETETTPDYYKKIADASTRDISFYQEEINGVLFVGFDNSDHKVTAEQFAKLKAAVETGKPVVLFCHVPLFAKELYDKSILDDGSAYLMAVPEELMKNYPEKRYKDQKADEVTYEAYEYIKAQENIKGILAGHVHFSLESKVGNIPQYVVGLNTVRLVTIK